ncbi:MAG: orotidine-5'-phosphate decarboxylase [Christensenellales bacterium]|jgi:orotidine-5'-phosphate decarboxylase|nr:orotidine-5'-phosphate decarboxylase [Clostridiales bacterium]
MPKDVIIALDYPDREAALAFLDQFGEEKPFVKIGMELFYAAGPDMVREIKDRGHKIFLDLKIHDIPNTAAGAVRSLRALGAAMMNLHAQGGIAMMRAAAQELLDTPGTAPQLIAVTVLTSLNEDALHDELLVQKTLKETVLHYAHNAKAAGLAGIVCSPLEAGVVHQRLGADFLTVTPGVRFADAEAGDQQRVTTPGIARELGADYIVVGRPITKAENPLLAYRRCMDEFVG